MPERFDIGFLGGGQLARMSIQAAQRMGLRCISLDPSADSPASQIAHAVKGDLDDPHVVAHILNHAKRVTLENEFIPASTIHKAAEKSGFNKANLIPGPDSLETIQDKLHQRQALARAGVPSPHAVPMESIEAAEREIGFPMVLKARFGGYDGKGTRYAKTSSELRDLESLWANGGWLAEGFVPFKRELAVMVARSPQVTFAYPTMETVQTNHVCDLVFPCDTDASELAIAAIEAIGGCGLFGVELFDMGNGEVQVNEIAPRPHNTGHYTLDWEAPSQFETHVRLVMGLPIHAVASSTNVVMANLLGQEGAGDYRKAISTVLKHEGAKFHWYGKKDAKPGRKMGHLNVVGNVGEPIEHIVKRAVSARSDFYHAWCPE